MKGDTYEPARSSQLKSPVLTEEQILYGLRKYRGLNFDTLQGRRALIDGFLHKVFFYNGYAVVTCNYKDGNEEISLEDIEKSGVAKEFEAQKNKPEQECSDLLKIGDPPGNLNQARGGCFTKVETNSSACKQMLRICAGLDVLRKGGSPTNRACPVGHALFVGEMRDYSANIIGLIKGHFVALVAV